MTIIPFVKMRIVFLLVSILFFCSESYSQNSHKKTINNFLIINWDKFAQNELRKSKSLLKKYADLKIDSYINSIDELYISIEWKTKVEKFIELDHRNNLHMKSFFDELIISKLKEADTDFFSQAYFIDTRLKFNEKINGLVLSHISKEIEKLGFKLKKLLIDFHNHLQSFRNFKNSINRNNKKSTITLTNLIMKPELYKNRLANLENKKLLIYTKTASFRHSSIKAGIKMFYDILDGYNIDITSSSEDYFFEDSNILNTFDSVVFLNTSGDILSEKGKMIFKQYLLQGGNFLGIHSAAYTMINWRWYTDVVGAVSAGHPKQQTAEVVVLNQNFYNPSKQNKFSIYEEWYNFFNIKESVVLHIVDEKSYVGGKNGDFHPITWCRGSDAPFKSFYTALGHKEDTYEMSIFRDLILAALVYLLDKDIEC